jgi:hypothetical protein
MLGVTVQNVVSWAISYPEIVRPWLMVLLELLQRRRQPLALRAVDVATVLGPHVLKCLNTSKRSTDRFSG